MLYAQPWRYNLSHNVTVGNELTPTKDHLQGKVQFTKPKGGYFVWVKLDPTINSSEFLNFAKEHYAVAFTPGQFLVHLYPVRLLASAIPIEVCYLLQS